MNFCLLFSSLLFSWTHATDLYSGFTDIVTREEYEEDVELIKISFDSTRPCRFFSDTRYPQVETGLANCTWYEKEACCKRTEVASVFESMFTLYRASQACRDRINYLMCFFCAPDQYLWYIKRRIKICQTFCDEIFKECRLAEYEGNVIGIRYKTGLQFCEAQNFNVVTNDCFNFNENAFSSAPLLSSTSFFLGLVSFVVSSQ